MVYTDGWNSGPLHSNSVQNHRLNHNSVNLNCTHNLSLPGTLDIGADANDGEDRDRLRQDRAQTGEPIPGRGNRSALPGLARAFVGQRSLTQRRIADPIPLQSIALLPLSAPDSIPLRRGAYFVPAPRH